jgi:hypothetical protein
MQPAAAAPRPNQVNQSPSRKTDLATKLLNSQTRIKYSEYKMAYIDWSISEEDLGDVMADLNA